jgi:phospholipid/cholesterol/gamma-HCH transport system permease protein
VIAYIGAKTVQTLSFFGRFGIFSWQTFRWLLPSLIQLRTWRRTMPLFYEVGNRTVPVIAVTGTFVGLVLAVQSYDQLKSAGFEQRMGVLVTLSLVQELGPVLAGVMVAGRVGGALTAELGTMRVTDAIPRMPVAHPFVDLLLRFLRLALGLVHRRATEEHSFKPLLVLHSGCD